MPTAAADIDQALELRKRKARRDTPALRAIQASHVSRKSFTPLGICIVVLERRLTVGCWKSGFAGFEDLFQTLPSAQYGIIVQDQCHIAQRWFSIAAKMGRYICVREKPS